MSAYKISRQILLIDPVHDDLGRYGCPTSHSYKGAVKNLLATIVGMHADIFACAVEFIAVSNPEISAGEGQL